MHYALRLVTGCAALLFPTVATAQGAGTAPRAPDFTAAAELLRGFVAEGRVAGAVGAVALQGETVYLDAVGMGDIDTRSPMTTESVFRIYSMTKPVTAVAIMILRDAGSLHLDDPVSRYIPEFERVFVADEAGARRPPSRPISIRDLLLHTSGLSHRTSPLYRDADVRSRARPLTQFIDDIVAVPLMEDPGTRFRYSEATTVLGRVVEVVSGQSLDAFMEEHIFRPLGMDETSFQVRPDQRERLATVYARGSDGLTPIEIEEALPFTEPPVLLEGAVGLVSTTGDFLRFSLMLLNGGELDGVRLLQSATVAEMTRNGLSEEVLRARGGTMGWALANVNVVLDPSRLSYPADVGEYGWDGSAGTIFWIDPEKRLVTILMTQSSPANPDRLREQFKTAVEEAVAAAGGS